MRTRSQSHNNFPQQEASPVIVEPLHIELPFLEDQFQEDPPVNSPEVSMADNRTMAELLQAPTEGYDDVIVILEIAANNFELKHSLINLVQNKQFFGHDKEDPHAHIRYFNKITSTMRVPNVSSSSIKLMLFPFSLEGAARIWLEKEAPRSILTWDDLVTKFIKQFFPPFGHDKEDPHAHIRYFNKITSTFKFPNVPNTSIKFMHFPFSLEGNFLDKMPRECFAIIESKSKVRYSCDNPVVAKVSTNASTSGVSLDVDELKDMVKALLLDKKGQNQSPAPVKAVEESCVTCGGAHSYRNYPATDGNVYRDNIQEFVSQASAVNYNQGNTIYRPPMMSNQIRPHGFPPVVQSESSVVNSKPITSEPEIAPVSASKPNPKASIPYPSRRNDERNREKANNQIEKFYQIFKDMKKLSEMAQTLLNEHCYVVLLKKLLEKLRDLGKFLIPCDFPCMAECLALADLGASINLMSFSVWKRLCLPDLTPTCMTLELADRSISRPVGVAEDVYVKTKIALIDVLEGKLTLQVGKEAITFNMDQTSRYSANYSDMKAKRIDVIDMAFEEYSQEVLGFFDTISGGSPTPYYDPIVSTTSLTLTPFGNSDFLLKEVDAFLAIEDEPTSSKFHQPYLDPEGDILLLEAFLNDDPSLPPPNQRNYLPEVRKELKICDAKSDKSSVDEPLVVELNVLPPHLEYAFLEGDNNLPVIIAKDLSVEEKTALLTVLKSHKRAIAWKLSDIKEKMLKRCEDTNLCLNWEKSHFMVKEGIVLGHKISKQGIEVDKAKVDVITKLPHPTTVKECVDAFQTLKRKLTEAPILIAPDWDMPFELMCDDSDFAIGAVLGQRQDKHFRPIHYASKTMTEEESNYTTIEK
nr:hypothetical protein [Tanacetum cinerariifolium]